MLKDKDGNKVTPKEVAKRMLEVVLASDKLLVTDFVTDAVTENESVKVREQLDKLLERAKRLTK